jgi:hypothetical protein
MYQDGDVNLYTHLLGAIFGIEMPKQETHLPFRHHRVKEDFIARGGGDVDIPPQSLNMSINNELIILERPMGLEHPIRLFSSDSVSFARLRDYIVPTLKIRAAVDLYLPRGITEDIPEELVPSLLAVGGNLVGEEAAPALKRTMWQLAGDLQVRAMHQLSWPEDASAIHELAYVAHGSYAKAWKESGAGCASCSHSMAQLMYLVGNKEQLLSDLTEGAQAAEGLARDQMIHMKAKFLASDLLRADIPFRRGDVSALQEISEVLEELRRGPYASVANFELGRAFFGRDDSRAITYLRSVLEQHPKHVFTRFLLAKGLSCREPSDANEAIDLLHSVLDDLAKGGGKYSEELHSLGIGDLVYYSVDPTYVLQDLISRLTVRCDESQLIKIIQTAKRIPDIDWNSIRTLELHQHAAFTCYYMYPAVPFYATYMPGICSYAERCPTYQELQRSAEREIGR